MIDKIIAMRTIATKDSLNKMSLELIERLRIFTRSKLTAEIHKSSDGIFKNLNDNMSNIKCFLKYNQWI